MDGPPEPGLRGTESTGLDLAFSWLQRNLDQLTEASRRTAAIARASSGTPSPAVPESVASPRTSPDPTAFSPSMTSSAASATPSEGTTVEPPSAPAEEATPVKSTPLLDKIGRDLTKLAAEGMLRPVIGRDDETAWMIEVLIRSSKRNPVLLGPAGVGKTAIVEGLAQRIVARRVPPPLLGVRIVEVPLASLTAGTQYRGQLEERVA